MNLTLAHSPDPDDAFMWWPLTGKVNPDGTPMPGAEGQPRIDTRGVVFTALPADIEVLNRRAAAAGDLDITAMSFRGWCDVKDRYFITHCGSSFGEGFGPKVVARTLRTVEDLRKQGVRIAIPGTRTTAFLLLNMLLGPVAARHATIIELPFEQIIGAVADGTADAGVVIHEGQLLFAEAGLTLVVDLGTWWGSTTGLPVPLGCNVVRSDLDDRFGAGSIALVSRLLHESIEYALAHRQESLEYTMPFALANSAKKGAAGSGMPTLERVDRYVAMYVNRWTLDMGEPGREAVRRLLKAGHDAGHCPDPGDFRVV